MSMTDPSIRDQAYQFFQQEAIELLQIIEEGLIKLKEEYETPHIHALMRAAHSIKGGAASVELPGIQKIAHRLEDVFRALYRRTEAVDDDIEEALLQAYDCLRLPLMEQFETGQFDAALAWEKAEPIFILLESVLQEEMAQAEFELPTSEELGIDLVHEIFSGDVRQGLDRLVDVLNHPEDHEVGGEVRTTAEVLEGLGELLGMSGFSAIAQSTIQALNHSPHEAFAIGQASLASFEAAYEGVMAGDRAEGGQPNPALLSFLEGDPSPASPAVEDETSNALSEPSAFEGLDAFFGASPSSEEAVAPTEPSEHSDAMPQMESLTSLENVFGSSEATPSLDDVFSQPETAPSLDDVFGSSESTPSLDDVFGQADATPSLDDVFGSSESTASLEDVFGQSEPAVESITPVSSDIPPLVSEAIAEPAQAPMVSAETPKEVAPVVAKAKKTSESIHRGESVRVDFDRLDRLNNLVGELVTQENGALLHNQQLQSQIKRLKQRFSEFDQLSQTLQKWMDQSVQDESRDKNLQFRAAPLTVNPKPQSLTALSSMAEFDPLQMDSYSKFYTTLQTALEEIAQMDEQLGDITLITQAAQRIQRQKQQTLKQVRNDLLWARMIPIEDILKRFPRMVRDLSSKFNKRVRFRQVGASTLVDKAVLERLYDPLVHLIRNAFDHGTESAEMRLASGKPAQATIEVRAYHRGNQTFIEVRDDGRGIDPDKLRQAALEKGVMSAETAAQASATDLYQLLFEPSFSTTTEVSELSGRGMGLNAVQSQVKALKGKVKIESEIGKGTAFVISLPLTLTIAKLLIFTVDGRKMSIPVDSLQGIIAADDTEISTIQGRSFYRDEEDLIPLYPPSEFMHHYPLPKFASNDSSTFKLAQDDKTPIILISSGSEMIALEVDHVEAEQELVIKPFGPTIAPPTYLYGCAILGDGALVPVIDGEVLLSKWEETQQTVGQGSSITSSSTPSITIESFHRYILVVDDSLTTRQNVTLTLQKFGYQVIQASDGREALNQLKKHPQIKAVVSDVEMPNMNGFEFLSTCRKTYPKEQLPVIMLTSRSGQKHQKIAQVLGANHYLTKPYLEQDLRGALDRCLEVVAC